MNRDKQDDWLDDLLAEEIYLEDNGFTDAVMARLPKSRLSDRRIKFYNWLAGCVASGIFAGFFPWEKITTLIAGLNAETWLMTASVTGAAFTALAVAAGIWSERATV